MIKRVEIKTIDDASLLFLDQQYNDNIHRLRTNYLYRGIPDTAYKLETSLRRVCRHRSKLIEPSILLNFTKYAINEDPLLYTSVWRQMILGQHHGLPTRLLDWTHSSLIALHFATSENNISDTDKRDGMVWRIDVEELAELLPPVYREKLKAEHSFIFSVSQLDPIANTTDKYDKDMGDHSMVIIEPPSLDQRIISQYSYFSIIPDGIRDIEKFLDDNTENTVCYVIDKHVRWDIRDMLDQFNISERVLYPGLDGLSKWIARHYYVMDSLYEEETGLKD